jgi:hypothetical protein
LCLRRKILTGIKNGLICWPGFSNEKYYHSSRDQLLDWDQSVKPNFQSKLHPFGLAVARNLHSKAFLHRFSMCLKLGGLLQEILGSILTANT